MAQRTTTMRSSISWMVALSSRGLALAFNITPKSHPSTFVRRRPLLSSRHLQGITTIHRCPSLKLSSDVLAESVLFLESMDRSAAESLAGPFFGASLFPYLGFLYFLDYPANGTPKGVTIGFATCLLFVFLTIPAAIGAQVGYGVSLADCDWLHGSAESLLTITNLITTLSFKSAVNYEVRRRNREDAKMPESYNSYRPMINVVIILTSLAFLTALYPMIATTHGASVHTPYLGGFLDILPPSSFVPSSWTPIHSEPDNALTVATWIIHISSLVEFLVAMGFCWKWADISNNMRWRGLTWGLLPLHTSGITAITYHLLYNSLPVLVPLQAALTLFGNSTAMYAAYRLALSNGWTIPSSWRSFLGELPFLPGYGDDASEEKEEIENTLIWRNGVVGEVDGRQSPFSSSLAGFEDLGESLAGDNNYLFVIKLFVGCAIVR